MKDIFQKSQLSDTWKIQLTIATNFMSSNNNDEERAMNLKSDIRKIMINDEVVKELFQSLLSRYQLR